MKRVAQPQTIGAIGACLFSYWAGAALLPNGLPFGIVLLGVVYGALSSLTALGLVLIYRSARVINFAQAEIGGLAAAVAIVMVAGWGLPYALAVPVGLAAAVGTGLVVEATVVRRFFTAPRLILTVATLGVAQVLGAGQIALPTLFTQLKPFTTFTTPFQFDHRIGPVVFTGDHLVVVMAVPIVLAVLAWFFGRSDLGIAVRAAADSNERAVLLGIPVRRLSRVSWTLAAGLSGLGAILAAPVLGASVGNVSGAHVLLAPLAAAVVARMERLPVVVGAAVGIGVFEQAVFWNYPRSSTIDVALFALILVALLAQRRSQGRVTDSGLGGYVAVKEVRPVPDLLRRLPEMRAARIALAVALVTAVAIIPVTLNLSRLTFVSQTAIYGMVGVSLVVLAGWAGQVSLGQFAFAGIGGAVTAGLLVHARLDLFLVLILAAAAGGLAAVAVGIPALRISGLFFAVTTLALAVPVSTYLLSPTYFSTLTPPQIPRPLVLSRFSLDSALGFSYLCLAALALTVILARNYRRSRSGRALVAVRDNERNAAAFAISPTRAKLAAFFFAGAVAGVAGGLHVVSLRSLPAAAFSPETSVQLFSMVVIGGLGSISGALLGALYVQAAFYFLHGAAQLLATGAGLLVLLMAVPGGLGELVFTTRDRLLRLVAQRRGLSIPSLAEQPDLTPNPTTSDDTTEVSEPAAPSTATVILSCHDVNASYGTAPVLFGVDVDVVDGEILALLGTNGAGKSSILRVIAGLLRPSRGAQVVFDGEDITRLDPVERVKRGLVVVPGGRGVFPSLTVAENLRVAGWLARRDHEFLAKTTEEAFSLFPILRERQLEKAGSLSGGEQQMLAIAQALFCRPRVLMIDELSLGLAPAVVAFLLDVVRRLAAEGRTVVVVEQSINIATTLAERAVFMERGEVRFTGRTADLIARGDLVRSVFLSTPSSPDSPTASISDRDPLGEAVLEVNGVAKSYGGIAALTDVTLHARRGEILGIIGSNGAGKTTLFDVCSGFISSDSGRISMLGRDVTSLAPAERAELGLGRLFQDARLFPSLTVAETIAVALERHVAVRDPFACALRLGAVVDSEREVASRVDELIDQLNLGRYRDAFISELSTGTRRVVELACALAHRPSVLLLDEPSSGIAQRESEALGGLLRDLRDQTDSTFVIIEHDVPLVAALSDRLICMHLGTVLSEGTPAEVLADPAVIASYLGDDDATIARSGAVAPARSSGSGNGHRPKRTRPLTATPRKS